MADMNDSKMSARVRMQRYREFHRRIDYVPSPEALAAIERRMVGLNHCMASVIDWLILEGHKALPETPKS
jgi:hypothetical protein